MGAAFSVIENNHIYNIHQKNQFSGAELAGIKIHAAIDTRIEKNRIHDVNAFGCWFDWMTQGTRISKNLMYNNAWQDLFFEVSHGPFLVDNNILLSSVGIGTMSEGGAFVHNLVLGKVDLSIDPSRFTPYQLPHSTAVAGLSTISSGDDRYYNNIFSTQRESNGTSFGAAQNGLASYSKAKLPVWISGNIYYNGANHYEKESNYVESPNFNPNVKIIEEGNDVYLQFTLDDSFYNQKNQLITTEMLGKAKMANEAYENPDGTPLRIDTDYFGNKRSEINPSPGPFENPDKGLLKLKVW
jgi:hypothetical protein